VGEVLLKDKFLTQSAPDIHKKLKVCGQWRKVIEQTNAMSVSYNWDLTKKRKKDKKTPTMTKSQLSGSAPPNGGLHPKLATIVDRRGNSTGNAQKGGQPGRQPWPPPTKVTTRGLSAPVSRWKAGCHYLWFDGSQSLLSRLHFLTSMLMILK
jgi:hypothetical protein